MIHLAFCITTQASRSLTRGYRDHCSVTGWSRRWPSLFIPLLSRPAGGPLCRRPLSSSPNQEGLSPYRELPTPYYHLVYNGSAPPVPTLDRSPEHVLRLRVEGKSHASQASASLVRRMHLKEGGGVVEKQVWATSAWLGKLPSRKAATYDLLAQAMTTAKVLGVQRLSVVVDSANLARELSGSRRVLAPDVSPLHQRVLAMSQDFPNFRVHVKGDVPPEDDEPVSDEEEGDTVFEVQSSAARLQSAGTVEGERRSEPEFLLRFDGGSRGNPGPAGAGVVIYVVDGDVSREVYAGSVWMGVGATNNEAEYKGLIEGLAVAKQLGIKKLKVEGDSQLIVRQITGEYQVKNERLKVFFQEAMALVKHFEKFDISYIERARNSRADALANAAMDNRDSFQQTLPIWQSVSDLIKGDWKST